jgi:hypothetical protein
MHGRAMAHVTFQSVTLNREGTWNTRITAEDTNSYYIWCKPVDWIKMAQEETQ